MTASRPRWPVVFSSWLDQPVRLAHSWIFESWMPKRLLGETWEYNTFQSLYRMSAACPGKSQIFLGLSLIHSLYDASNVNDSRRNNINSLDFNEWIAWLLQRHHCGIDSLLLYSDVIVCWVFIHLIRAHKFQTWHFLRFQWFSDFPWCYSMSPELGCAPSLPWVQI